MTVTYKKHLFKVTIVGNEILMVFFIVALNF